MSNQFSWVHRLLERSHIILGFIASLIVSLMLALAIGKGEYLRIWMILGMIGAGTVILKLGRYYWLLIPLAFSSELPAVPLGGSNVDLSELSIIICTIVFLLRYGLKRQTFTLFRKSHVPVLLFTAWAVFIFSQNPVGLSQMGAEVGGARFYVKILMALAAFLIMANQQIGERECKWFIILILAGSVLSSAKEIASFYIPSLGGLASLGDALDPEDYYSWHQALASVPLAIVLLLFSCYRAVEIFSLRRLSWLTPVFFICVGFIVASGKRSAVATLPAYAIVAAILRREFGYVMAWIGGAVVATVLVIGGHNTLFHLPLTAQRALSWMPAHWDPEMEIFEGGKDEFRAMLRQLAWEKVQRDPWIGTGYRVSMAVIQRHISLGGGGIEGQVMPFALGSAWHNTWFGYAADFGIPASILQGIILATYFLIAWRTFYRAKPATLAQAMTVYFALFFFRDIIYSGISGHSALDAFSRWWMYGMAVSLVISIEEQKSKPSAISLPAAVSPIPRTMVAGSPVRNRLKDRSLAVSNEVRRDPSQRF